MSAPRNPLLTLDERLDSYGVPRKITAPGQRRDQLERIEATRWAIEQARSDGATEIQLDDQIRPGTERAKSMWAPSGPMAMIRVLRSLIIGGFTFSYLINGRLVTYIDRDICILPASIQDLLSNLLVHLAFGLVIAIAHVWFCKWLVPKKVIRQHNTRRTMWNPFG